MIKGLGWLIKIGFFSILVLVVGNSVKWGGRTISDQVKAQVAHVEKSRAAGSIVHWTQATERDLRANYSQGHSRVGHTGTATHAQRRETSARTRSAEKSAKTAKRPEERSQESIASSERQKLRALIQELNSSESADSRN